MSFEVCEHDCHAEGCGCAGTSSTGGVPSCAMGCFVAAHAPRANGAEQDDTDGDARGSAPARFAACAAKCAHVAAAGAAGACHFRVTLAATTTEFNLCGSRCERPGGDGAACRVAKGGAGGGGGRRHACALGCAFHARLWEARDGATRTQMVAAILAGRDLVGN